MSGLPGCLYRGQECRLVIHYEQGFSVLADPTLGENGEERGAHTPTKPQVLLSYPYEKLKMSSDDGVRMLFLDFGGKEGEIVSVSLCFFLKPKTQNAPNGSSSSSSSVFLSSIFTAQWEINHLSSLRYFSTLLLASNQTGLHVFSLSYTNFFGQFCVFLNCHSFKMTD